MKRSAPLSRTTTLRRTAPLERTTQLGRKAQTPVIQTPSGNTAPVTPAIPKRRKALPARNEERRPAAPASAQHKTVMERDDYRCVFEVRWDVGCLEKPGTTLIVERGDTLARAIVEEDRSAWVRCDAPAVHAAHVWRRSQVANREAIDDPDECIAGCERCHVAFDNYRREAVRIPRYAIDRARTAINRVVLPENRIPDHVDP